MPDSYAIKKQGFPFAVWLEAIQNLIVPVGNDAPDGVWRELLTTSMLREQHDEQRDGLYYTHFIPQGGIRGVIIHEHEEEIEIRLLAFASRIDWSLAVRFLYEAAIRGGKISFEGDEELTLDDLSSEYAENTFQRLWDLSVRSVPDAGKPINPDRELSLPIISSLIGVNFTVGEVFNENLEAELIARVERVANSFLPSGMVLGSADGRDEIEARVIQKDLSTLIEKKGFDAVILRGQKLVSLDAFIDAFQEKIIDATNSWVVPPLDSLGEEGIALIEQLPEYGAQNAVGGSSDSDSFGLTPAEQKIIAKAPFYVFVLIAAADGKVDKKEMLTFASIAENLYKQQDHIPTSFMMHRFFEDQDAIMEDVKSSATKPSLFFPLLNDIIERRFSATDAAILRMFLYLMAEKIASSSGGILGLGSKISKEEKAALSFLAHAFGLGE